MPHSIYSKPRILVVIGAFLPGYKAGGPIPSVAHLVARLGGEFEFLILTADRDLGDGEPFPGVDRDCWVEAFGVQIRYCSPESLSLRRLAEIICQTPHDLLYLNSFFNPRFTIVPLLARWLGWLPSVPVLLAPRGEFSPGALALKPMKKRFFIQIGQAIGMTKGLYWHASTDCEVTDIHKVMRVSSDRSKVASDLVAPLPEVPPPHTPRAQGAPLRILFLSRLSPKKNLDFVLEVLMGVDVTVRLTVVGTEEDVSYVSKCRKLASALPEHVTIEWGQAIPPKSVPSVMAAHDLFFLPTRGENFGHVIAEALGAGTPVLISDATPWRGLADLGIGYDLPLGNLGAFREALSQVWKWEPQETARVRERAFTYARERQRDGADVEANRDMFRSILAGTGS